ncbi:hypothetical protein BZA05DRAFT_413060 [Tricharina praecox]|uniref:uncharacterized protein n=1 Tax=Tricharina praecox TaxID=43433 RepID=UPI002220292A|nr:uncharacterized protein BZA05DRAFT_413060 [Tricharina praecox]KAI5841619.1 hypothetical protein BZA05DRAFT_413060 [Tricharina praecox]
MKKKRCWVSTVLFLSAAQPILPSSAASQLHNVSLSKLDGNKTIVAAHETRRVASESQRWRESQRARLRQPNSTATSTTDFLHDPLLSTLENPQREGNIHPLSFSSRKIHLPHAIHHHQIHPSFPSQVPCIIPGLAETKPHATSADVCAAVAKEKGERGGIWKEKISAEREMKECRGRGFHVR